jgi:lactoylglutathione lyase
MVANQTMTRITGVRTVGIPVRDQDRALEFYTQKLGLERRLDMAYGRERWIGRASRLDYDSCARSGT